MWRLLPVLIILMTSCSEEVISYMPGIEPTPVMYGLINVDDTVNSVRITKTFSGPINAYELAKDTNNLFYEDLTAKIQCLTMDYSLYSEYPLVKTYIPRDTTGIFQTSKNWVYAYLGHFPPRDSFYAVRVLAFLPNGDTVQTGTLTVLPKPKMIYPNRATKTISLYEDGALKIEIFQHYKIGIKLRINLLEMRNGREVSKSIEEFIYRINYSYFNITPGRFITILNENLQEDNSIEYRKIQSIDVFGYTASPAFMFYHQTMGTEYDFNKSPYSNYVINGYGLVLPYSVDSIMGLKFDYQTMDSLVNGEHTERFKFVKWD